MSRRPDELQCAGLKYVATVRPGVYRMYCTENHMVEIWTETSGGCGITYHGHLLTFKDIEGDSCQ